MKQPNVTFEILFLVLIVAKLTARHVAGQSSLSLDLHKQSQRTKQALPAGRHDVHAERLANHRNQPSFQHHHHQYQHEQVIYSASKWPASSGRIDDHLRLKRESAGRLDEQPVKPSDADQLVLTNSNGLGGRFEPSPVSSSSSSLFAQNEDEPQTSSPLNQMQVSTQSGARNADQEAQWGAEQSSSSPSARDISATHQTGQMTTTTTSSTSTTSAPSSTQNGLNYELSTAELCYLANGGSSLTLTVNEATQVGTSIGTIDVNGDPSLEGGNVDLQVDGGGGGGEPNQLSETWSSRHMQTAGSHVSSPSSISSLATPSSSSSSRQIRRLLGRRDTSSSFYSLVSSGGVGSPSSQAAGAQPALRLEPGSKELVLARPLDKESPEGDSSLLVQVRCRPRGQLDSGKQAPSAVIPIRLIITDANDHAPEFLGAQSYVINISETALPGAPLQARDILALDRDSAGPHSTIHYHVLDQSGAPIPAALALDQQADYKLASASATRKSNYSHLSHHFAFTNPLEPILWLTSALDYESLPAPSFMLTIVAQDQAEPEPLQSTAQVQINVLDFDDQNPKFLDEKYSLVMDEHQSNLVGQNLRVLPRNLRAEDGDRGIMAPIVYAFDSQSSSSSASSNRLLDAFGSSSTSVASVAESALSTSDSSLDDLDIESYLHLNPNSGELRLIRQWPQRAGGGGPLTLVVRATQADNRDRYALTTLTITRGSAGLPANSLAGHNQPVQSRNKSAVGASRALGELESNGGGGGGGKKLQEQPRGIAFLQDKLYLEVPENTPTNEKLARARARHLDERLVIASSTVDLSENNNQSRTGPIGDVDGTTAEPTMANNRTASGDVARRIMRLPAAQSSDKTAPTTSFDKRPISYQILDDQMDQFGINGLGELFLKRPLDYEQRQEFKLRLLATHTKYSDICHVQLAVLNVNDNKPKFTQSQYSFHLTEARLRANAIGSLQAHDADLNDTIKYSIQGEQPCAKLFEFANPLSGQLSLRPSIGQLNVSQCQFLVLANDSLGALAERHSQQARVTLYVAPQMVGKPIQFNLNANQLADSQPTNDESAAATRAFHSRASFHSPGPEGGAAAAAQAPTAQNGGGPFYGVSNKAAANHQRARQMSLDQQTGESSTHSSSTFVEFHQQQQQPGGHPQVSNQRSSLATVMASLQHMVRSVNILEMPMSSALLLSVLLAFLVCLLLIVVVSMSLHVYRRRSKSRRRRHLTAAAHLRHAHLAAAAAAAAAATAAANTNTSGHLAMSTSYKSSSAYDTTTSTSPASSSPSSSTSLNGQAERPSSGGAGGPNQRKQHQQHQRQQSYFDNFALSGSSKSVALSGSAAAPTGKSSATTAPDDEALASTNDTSLSTASSAATAASAAAKRPPLAPEIQISSGGSQRPFEELKISTTDLFNQSPLGRNQTTSANSSNVTYLKSSQAMAGAGKKPPVSSLISSLTATNNTMTQAEGSSYFASNFSTDDDSSMMHCGHYSVNGTIEHRQHQLAGQKQLQASGLRAQGNPPRAVAVAAPQNQARNQQTRDNTSRLLDEMKSELAQQQRRSSGPSQQKQQQQQASRTRSSIEAAIRSLVRQDQERDDDDDDDDDGERGHGDDDGERGHGDAEDGDDDDDNDAGGRLQLANKFKVIQSSCDDSEVGELTASGKPGIKSYRRLPLMNSLVRPVRSQLASLASSNNKVAPAAISGNQQLRNNDSPGEPLDYQGGLMARVRAEANSGGGQAMQQQQQIRWPAGALPQRTKRLTWDDELSCCREDGASNVDGQERRDCYVSPDVRLGGPLSPLNREHLYSSPKLALKSTPTPGGESGNVAGAVEYLYSPSSQQNVPRPNYSNLPSLMAGAQHDNLSSAQNTHNRNNCLDYTIVQSSQFHADSLAAVASSSRSALSSRRLAADGQAADYLSINSSNATTTTPSSSNFIVQKRPTAGPCDTPGEHYYYEQSPGYHQQPQPQQLQQTMAAAASHYVAGHGGQLEATNKLRQNYQDLKLMTTAVL